MAEIAQKPVAPEETPVVPQRYKLTFFMLVTCFVLWGLLNNMTDNLVPAFGKIFMMPAVDSSMVQFFFYGAYAVLAIPASLIIKRWSFRHGLLVGLGFYMIGALGYIPAAIMQNYDIFLWSIFILAGGLSVLETTCNPYVLALGDDETLGSMAGLFLAKFLILAHLHPATYDERMAMSAQELTDIRFWELFWVCVPYVGLIAIAAVIWVYFFFHGSTMKDNSGPIEFTKNLKKLLANRKYVFGVITQFFYVGMQITVWTWMIKYIMVLNGLPEHEAVNYYIYAMFLFIGCRWLCTYLMKWLHAPRLMAVIAVLGMAVCLGTVYLPGSTATMCLMLISACMSLMFPTIYGIALRGLGDEVKLGAAGLIMAIVGGALITPLQGQFIDAGTLSFLASGFSAEEAAVRTSYFVPFVCMIVVFLYAVFNWKKNK